MKKNYASDTSSDNDLEGFDFALDDNPDDGDSLKEKSLSTSSSRQLGKSDNKNGDVPAEIGYRESGLSTFPPGSIHTDDPIAQYYAILRTLQEGRETIYEGDPLSYLTYPVFDSFNQDRKVVASIFATIQWSSYLTGVVPPNSEAVTVVLENTCDGAFTYTASNGHVHYEGPGDWHDKQYDNLERRSPLISLVDGSSDPFSNGFDDLGCKYNIRVYPTRDMEEAERTHIPILTTLCVGLVFVFMAIVFCVYNVYVDRRQELVLTQATQSTAIVSSLFPETIRDRLLPGSGKSGSKDSSTFISPTSRIKSFLAGGVGEENGDDNGDFAMDKPLADLFPFTTILFADIAGFTAWSSTREPAQVFVLLQTIYQAFDQLAHKYDEFKVETIGDSYVAATGLPNEQPRHALLMAKFAEACVRKFVSLVKELEVRLGPDTADLALRVGLNSGPVTAGVLRGERARFQLFGDTVNTAARMESTGKPNCIHVSSMTAIELEKQGKGHLLSKRQDAVVAKGKGQLETYWLNTTKKQGRRHSPTTSSSDSGGDSAEVRIERIEQGRVLKHGRLVNWCVELLADHLRRVVARRQALKLDKNHRESASFPARYEGECNFFDNYIIPLAKKLKDCNVFGASSDECLNYAQQNRREWEARGQEIVADLVAKTAVANSME